MIFINLLGVFTIFILLNESFIFVSLPNSPSHMSIWIKKMKNFSKNHIIFKVPVRVEI
jgi:hypothetical protein